MTIFIRRTKPPQRVKARAIGSYPRYTGVEIPEGAVYVGREMYGHPGSPFANQFGPAAETRQAYGDCVSCYRGWLLSQPELVERARRELRGRDLACWCRRKTWPCHADVLLEVANSPRIGGDLVLLPTLMAPGQAKSTRAPTAGAGG